MTIKQATATRVITHSDCVRGVRGYQCWVEVMNTATRSEPFFVDVVVPCPGDFSIRNLIWRELGKEYLMLNWNVGDTPF